MDYDDEIIQLCENMVTSLIEQNVSVCSKMKHLNKQFSMTDLWIRIPLESEIITIFDQDI